MFTSGYLPANQSYSGGTDLPTSGVQAVRERLGRPAVFSCPFLYGLPIRQDYPSALPGRAAAIHMRHRRELLERFGSVVSLHVAEASPKRTFVHAGVVGWGRSAILIPGRSSLGRPAWLRRWFALGRPTILMNLRWWINEAWSIPTHGHCKYGKTDLTAKPDVRSKRSEGFQEKGPCPSGWSSSAAISRGRVGLPASSHQELDC